MHANQKIPKITRAFYACKPCDYITSHLGDWNKHLTTAKHAKLTNANKKSHDCICGCSYQHKESLSRHKKVCMIAKMGDHTSQKVIQSYPKSYPSYICECGRTYKYASGLSKHRKKCPEACSVIPGGEEEGIDLHTSSVNNEESESTLVAAIRELKKDNEQIRNDNTEMKSLLGGLKELHGQVLEVAKEPKFITNNNNINVFLTQQCAEALSLDDFIQRLSISMGDLEYTMENGKRAGIAQIIRRGFDELGVYKRPMHCTDLKRQTMYIKDDGLWSKDSSKEKMDRLVREVDGRQFKASRQWEQNNPDFNKRGKVQDKWLMLINTLTKPMSEVDISLVSRKFAKDIHIDRKSLSNVEKDSSDSENEQVKLELTDGSPLLENPDDDLEELE